MCPTIKSSRRLSLRIVALDWVSGNLATNGCGLTHGFFGYGIDTRSLLLPIEPLGWYGYGLRYVDRLVWYNSAQMIFARNDYIPGY